MADERLRTELVAAGYDEELVWSWEREDLISRYAEVLLEGAKPKVATAPVDPALERDHLAFEMKRWEAEQEEKKLQREEAKQRQEEKTKRWEAEQQRHEAEQEERRLQRGEDIKKLEFEKMKAEQDHQRWMADRDDKRRQEQAEEMRREAEQGRQDESCLLYTSPSPRD